MTPANGIVGRLAMRDLRRRTAESVLLLVALTLAATTLTIGLVLHGQSATPYAETKSATRGPDVVGVALPDAPRVLSPSEVARFQGIAHDPGVTASSGLIPTTWTAVRAANLSGVAEVQGRSRSPGAVDRPKVVDGTWIRTGGAVVERAFAQALGVGVGDRIRLGARTLPVVGIAVSAALPPYPQLCYIGCILNHPSWHTAHPGLVWLTRHDLPGLVTPQEPVSYLLYLRLSPSQSAPAFAARHAAQSAVGPGLFPWQEVARPQVKTLDNERTVVIFGSSLLIVLALATAMVLIAGRMIDEVRRVGTLKAMGASPGFVVGTLLAAYLTLGVIAALLGLVLGWLVGPRLITLSAGLLGARGATSVSLYDVAVVLGTMIGIVVVSTAIPAWRAARTSTVRALADAGRSPRRSRTLIALSARLPAPGLVGLRLAARRPRRAILTTCSIAVAVCGAFVVIFAQASINADSGPAGGPADPTAQQLHSVMVAVTVLLSLMAAVNLVFVTRSAAADARRTLAVIRAMGASPAEAAIGLAVAQILPVITGVILGALAGVLLFGALAAHTVTPPAESFAAVVAAVIVATIALIALPARWEAKRPVADVLRPQG